MRPVNWSIVRFESPYIAIRTWSVARCSASSERRAKKCESEAWGSRMATPGAQSLANSRSAGGGAGAGKGIGVGIGSGEGALSFATTGALATGRAPHA